MAKIAAIKNVLSPISEAKIIDAERRNPSSCERDHFHSVKVRSFSLSRDSSNAVSQKWRIWQRRVHIHHIARKSRALVDTHAALSPARKRSAFFSSSRGICGSLNGSSSRKAGKEEAEEKSLSVVFPAGRKRRHF